MRVHATVASPIVTLARTAMLAVRGAPLSRRRGRLLRAGVGPLVLMLLAGAAAGRAGETPGQKCTVTKLKAAFKKAGAKGACFEKAIGTAAMVDTACLGKADASFGLAFQKAEAKGG